MKKRRRRWRCHRTIKVRAARQFEHREGRRHAIDAGSRRQTDDHLRTNPSAEYGPYRSNSVGLGYNDIRTQRATRHDDSVAKMLMKQEPVRQPSARSTRSDIIIDRRPPADRQAARGDVRRQRRTAMDRGQVRAADVAAEGALLHARRNHLATGRRLLGCHRQRFGIRPAHGDPAVPGDVDRPRQQRAADSV